jgi:membrane protein YqaA with SNARE-associated domain
VVGGMMKVPAPAFFILVGLGKGLRYAAVIIGLSAF